jgi:hypothetical protein
VNPPGDIVLHWHALDTEEVLRRQGTVANTYALAAVALSLALQIVAVQFAPLAAVLDLTPLAAGEWALAVGLGAVPAVVGQALKSARTSR